MDKKADKMNDENFDPEQAAVNVFSYLIRGMTKETASNKNDPKYKNVKKMLLERMAPMKRLYAISDDLFPIYVDYCIKNKKFMKVSETMEVFGNAINEGKVPPEEEKLMMEWVKHVMLTNKTTGNIKTKRR
jgi:hypothetical protein